MSPSKILAIKLRALGDTVLLSTPLLVLRERFPKAKIHVLVPEAWACVLHRNPAVDRIWTLDRSLGGFSKAKALSRLAYQLRREKFDCTINFHASSSSALLARSTGAKHRSIHFHGHKAKNRYSTLLVPGKAEVKPIIERDMDAVRALGLDIPSGLLPQIFLSESELSAASILTDGEHASTPILGINLGASRPTKLWPIERFAELAVKWCIEEKGSAIALAGPGEDPLIHRFLEQVEAYLKDKILDPEIRLALTQKITGSNRYTLRRLTALLSQLSVVVGGDSGPKHLAIAVKTPTVTLFGPEDPVEWHPYPKDKNPYLFIESLSCRRDADPGYPPWCALNECVIEKHRCMQEIRVESVLMHCQKVAKRQ